MELVTVGSTAVSEIVNAIKDMLVIKKEDATFLQEHSAHLALVLEKTHMWRTNVQKMSIISDFNYPTLHGKLHQSILEQKVQFDQAMYLAKDFELKKLEVEEIECDIENLSNSKRDLIEAKKSHLEIKFKQYELKNMQIAMDYRMKEVKGWQTLIDQLLAEMRKAGLTEEFIWEKNEGEVTHIFFSSLNNLQGLSNSSDGAEVNNLISLAKFAIQQTKQLNIFDKLVAQCNTQQLNFLKQLGELGA